MMMSLKLPIVENVADYQSHFNDDIWQKAAVVISNRHGISYTSLRRSQHGENIIFFVDAQFIIKIFAPFREGYLREKAALKFAVGKLEIETPKILFAGELEGWSYLVMTQLVGFLAKDVWSEIEQGERIEIVSRLGIALKQLHSHAAPLSQSALNFNWYGFIEQQVEMCVERQRACGANPEWLKSLPSYIAERLELLRRDDMPVMLHGDVHLGNLLLSQRGGCWKITGLFDFGDSLCGFHEYEFVAPGVLIMQGDQELQRAFFLAYGYEESQLDINLRSRLMLLTILYECSDLRKYAMRLMPKAVNFTLNELEAAIWRFE